MLSTGLVRSIVPIYLYPRHPLRALSISDPGHPLRPPRSCSQKPIVHPRGAVSPLHLSKPTRRHNRALSETSRLLATTRTSRFPFHTTVKMHRPSTPYTDPQVQGPRAQQLASGSNAGLLRSMMMNPANTVNKTGLHPSGVAYVPCPTLPTRCCPRPRAA